MCNEGKDRKGGLKKEPAVPVRPQRCLAWPNEIERKGTRLLGAQLLGNGEKPNDRLQRGAALAARSA